MYVLHIYILYIYTYKTGGKMLIQIVAIKIKRLYILYKDKCTKGFVFYNAQIYIECISAYNCIQSYIRKIFYSSLMYSS